MLFLENGRLCPPTCPPPTLVMLRNWKFLMVLLKYCVYFEVLPVGAHSRNRKKLVGGLLYYRYFLRSRITSRARAHRVRAIASRPRPTHVRTTLQLWRALSCLVAST